MTSNSPKLSVIIAAFNAADRIDAGIVQNCSIIAMAPVNAEPISNFVEPIEIAVSQRHQFDVGERWHGRQMALRHDASSPNHGQAQRRVPIPTQALHSQISVLVLHRILRAFKQDREAHVRQQVGSGGHVCELHL